jgi:hypothetical protein
VTFLRGTNTSEATRTDFFRRSWGTDQLHDADPKWGKQHSSASSQERRFYLGNDRGYSKSVHIRNDKRKYAEDTALEEIQDSRIIKAGTKYSSIFHSLPIIKTKIAAVQEIMGQKDFQLRSDGPRENKKKHDKCDHSKDPSVQKAES